MGGRTPLIHCLAHTHDITHASHLAGQSKHGIHRTHAHPFVSPPTQHPQQPRQTDRQTDRRTGRQESGTAFKLGACLSVCRRTDRRCPHTLNAHHITPSAPSLSRHQSRSHPSTIHAFQPPAVHPERHTDRPAKQVSHTNMSMSQKKERGSRQDKQLKGMKLHPFVLQQANKHVTDMHGAAHTCIQP